MTKIEYERSLLALLRQNQIEFNNLSKKNLNPSLAIRPQEGDLKTLIETVKETSESPHFIQKLDSLKLKISSDTYRIDFDTLATSLLVEEYGS